MAAVSSSSSWADAEEASGPTSTDGVAQVTAQMSNVQVEEKKEPAAPSTGLDPSDNKAEVVVTNSIYQSASTFEQLGLSEALLKGVYAMGFTHPSKIQANALPVILAAQRQNLIGQAHHGSGKTATFALSMLSNVDSTKNTVQAVCVCPTRELATQVYDVVCKLGKFSTTKAFLAVPGSEQRPVTEQILIGTPGTVIAKIKHREVNAREVRLFVVDEADEMLKRKAEGLSAQTQQIQQTFPKNHQVLLFSATFTDQVNLFCDKIAPNAVRISIKREELSLDQIAQFSIDCENEAQKYQLLKSIYGLLNIGQSIVFVQSVATAKDLTNKMRADGFTVSLIHGQLEAKDRDVVMMDFREGRTAVLITTNLIARGIDVLQVTLVVNYEMPTGFNQKADPETYIHRIGRSGRFGRKGVALNLVHDAPSRENLSYIARYFDKQIVPLPRDDLEKIEELVKNALKD